MSLVPGAAVTRDHLRAELNEVRLEILREKEEMRNIFKKFIKEESEKERQSYNTWKRAILTMGALLSVSVVGSAAIFAYNVSKNTAEQISAYFEREARGKMDAILATYTQSLHNQRESLASAQRSLESETVSARSKIESLVSQTELRMAGIPFKLVSLGQTSLDIDSGVRTAARAPTSRDFSVDYGADAPDHRNICIILFPVRTEEQIRIASGNQQQELTRILDLRARPEDNRRFKITLNFRDNTTDHGIRNLVVGWIAFAKPPDAACPFNA